MVHYQLHRILGLLDRSHAFIIVSHTMRSLRELCNRGLWLNRGRLVADGPIDRVIDVYAHFIALSEGVAQLAAIRQQEMQDLENYYKYRHNKSTDGMQQLIDKYKTPAKTKDPFGLP